MTFYFFKKRNFLFAFSLATAIFLQQIVFPFSAQAISWSLNSEISGTPQFLVVGDKVDVTLRVYTQNKKPLIQDRKFTFKIYNPKPGQNCQTTDDNLKEDGVVKGFCEAKGDPGNMEIGVDAHNTNSTFEVDGVWYDPWVSARYNAMFIDPKESCQSGAVAPSAVAILKQNDVTVKVDWQHIDKYVGSYEVIYGNSPGNYTGSRRTESKSLIVDGLEPLKEYYFKVQANSACKWTATSPLYKYIPTTGAVSLASEKPKASPSPGIVSNVSKSKSSPTPAVLASPSPATEVKETESIEMKSPEPTTSPSPEVPAKKSVLQKIWLTVTSFFGSRFSR